MKSSFVGFVALSILHTPVLAADFSIVKSEKKVTFGVAADILMKGPVLEGDKNKLEEVIKKAPWELNPFELRIRMNSGGGNLAPGIELGEYIYQTGIQTYVGPGDSCLSACAIAFMFGAQADGDDSRGKSRTIHHTATLGFHAPYAFEKNKKIPDRVREALLPEAERGARQAGSDLVRLNVTGKLPSDLIQELLIVEQEDFLLVDTVDRAARWDIQIEGANPLFELHHKRLETFCTNRFAWDNNIPFEKRTSRHDVSLLSTNDGKTLTTSMMEFDCNLALQNRVGLGISKPAIFENDTNLVFAWQSLPADVLLNTLGPEEVIDGTGPSWNQRYPIVSSDGQVDYKSIKSVSGKCKDSIVWTGGWHGDEGSDDYKDFLYSYATVAVCGGGFGPMSIECEPDRNVLKFRFAYGNSQFPNDDGQVTLDIDGIQFVLKGQNGDVYGHKQVYADVSKQHPLLEALKASRLLKLVGDGPNQAIHLNGSRKAIEAMEISCR